MGNVLRYVRGATNVIALPKATEDEIELGDLLYWDANRGAVRNAETIAGETLNDKKAAFAAAFVGVALTAHPAGSAGQVSIATSGDYLFAAPSGSGTGANVGDGVAVGDSSAIGDQVVSRTTTPTHVIGRVLAPKGPTDGTVLVRIIPVVNK